VEKPENQTERVINYYGRTAEEYDKGFEALYWKQIYDGVTWRYIEPYLPMKGLVLDAGGGTGKWMIPMAERGLRVMLYDISQQMLDVAEKKARLAGLQDLVEIVQGDICDIKFPDNHFDFVLAEGDPISYCADPRKAVKELARVLKPGGYISAGVDSLFPQIRNALNEKLDLEAALRILHDGRFRADVFGFDCWAFMPKSLRELFESAKLRVVKIAGKPVTSTKRVEPLLQDPDKARKLLELELALCEDEGIVGNGGHLHIVAKKPGRMRTREGEKT